MNMCSFKGSAQPWLPSTALHCPPLPLGRVGTVMHGGSVVVCWRWC